MIEKRLEKDNRSNKKALVWKDISIRVNEKAILENCWGYSEPGSLVAIMGQSGAGKTTLLSVICGQRLPNMKMTGSIEANGKPYTFRDFFKFGSYVRQNDVAYETLTVAETLQFTARLKIKDEEQAEKKVSQLIKVFELEKCENAKVGGALFKGISGGQKKRLCIALEMIDQPSILVLDEPTSGLDSNKAIKVLNVLKKLSEKGKNILLTIHQPSFLLYKLLDSLIILNKGRTIYSGKASYIQNYMKSLHVQISTKSNICDTFMFQVSEYKAKTQNYSTPFNHKNYCALIQPGVKEDIKRVEGVWGGAEAGEKQHVGTGNKFFTLLKREARIFCSNPFKIGRVFLTICIQFFLVGTVFHNEMNLHRPSTQEYYFQLELLQYFLGAQGLCFVNISSIILSRMYTTALVFPEERQVFIKESLSETYPTWCYFFGKVLIEVPILCMGALTYALGTYWLMGFTHDATKFALFCVVMTLLSVVGNSMGLLIGSLFKDGKTVTTMIPLFLVPLMLLSGIFHSLNDIQPWIRWLQYLSPFKYGSHLLLLNQFDDKIYNLIPPPAQFDYKQKLGIDSTFSENLLITVALSLGFYLLSYLLLNRASSKVII